MLAVKDNPGIQRYSDLFDLRFASQIGNQIYLSTSAPRFDHVCKVDAATIDHNLNSLAAGPS